MAAAAAGSLAGQRVAIFGGSSGMGRGAAAAVLRSGASVVLIGRDEAKLAATKVWLGGDSRVSTLVADANDEAAVKAAFSTLFPPEQPRLNHVLCTVGPSVGGGARWRSRRRAEVGGGASAPTNTPSLTYIRSS